MRMRLLMLGAVICGLAMGTAARAQAPDPQVIAPIEKFLAAFNKGDVAGAAATHATEADLVIVDEVAPYIWRGPQAFQGWIGDLDRDSKARGISDQHVKISAPTRLESDGSTAYVIVSSTYTFKEKGVAMREAAQMTFVVKKGANGWMIHGWTWTGPKAQKVSAAAK